MTETGRAIGTLAKFGYFVLQVRAVDNRRGLELSGVLENLGTGEKQAFASGDDLTRLLTHWGELGKDAGRLRRSSSG